GVDLHAVGTPVSTFLPGRIIVDYSAVQPLKESSVGVVDDQIDYRIGHTIIGDYFEWELVAAWHSARGFAVDLHSAGASVTGLQGEVGNHRVRTGVGRC